MSTWLRRVYPLLTLAIGAALLNFMLWFAQHTANPDRALAISELEFQAASTNAAPIDSNWQPVTLPDDWYHSERTEADGWYRYRFELIVAPNRLWGVYMPNVQQNAAIFLNGALLGSGGKFSDPVARNWNRPLYFTIPNGHLLPGENLLTIHIKADPVINGLLSAVYVGPNEILQPVFELRYFYRATLAQFIVITLFLTSMLMLMLWWNRRSETIYAWYAITHLVWALHNLNMVVVNIPVSTRLWEWMMYGSMLWFSVLVSSFIQRFIGQINVIIERIFYALACFFSVLLLLLPDSAFYWMVTRITDPFALAIGLYTIFRLLKYIQQEPRQEAFLMILTGYILIMFAVHDVLALNYLISRVDGLFLYYGAPLGLLLFSYILIKRFVSSMNETEQLNLHLESKIKHKSRKLENTYQKLRTIDKQRVLAEERGRLMRDMHDGMGGHLISTLSLIETSSKKNEPLRESLQMALDDLRMMIHSMEEVEGDVLTVLAMLRQRMEPRLNKAGITIQWCVEEIPRLSDLGPDKSLQLLRIFQEAITNVLKHSAAQQITFKTELKKNEQGAPCIYIECRDNGKGFVNPSKPGHGLTNIKYRAQKMGGYAEIKPAEEGGIRVSLWIPVNAEQLS